MSQADFETGESSFSYRGNVPEKGMAVWLTRKGIARDVKQANAILLGVLVSVLLLSGAVYFFGSPDTPAREIDYTTIPQFLPPQQ